MRLLFCFLLTTNFMFAQVSTNIESQLTFGGSGSDYLSSVILTATGETIVGGTSSSPISGDKTTINYGLQDFWVVQFDNTLSTSWELSLGGNQADILTAVIQTLDGGILCLGESQSGISGNKTSTNIGGVDFWLVKLDAMGNILWQENYGGTNDDHPYSMIEYANGDILLVGNSNSPISGNKTESVKGIRDYWILKVDASGNVKWDKTIGGDGVDQLPTALIDEDQNVYIGGRSTSGISFDKSEESYGSLDCWIVKIDENGNIIWDKTLGGSSIESEPKLVIQDNHLYAACASMSNASGTKTEDSKGLFDYWITKLDTSGNIIWDKTIGGDDDESMGGLMFSTNGELMISGSSKSSISFDKTEPNIGNRDYWLVAIDSNGDVLMDKTIGGTGFDNLVTSVEILPSTFRMIGYSDSNISGDKDEDSRGDFDFWIADLSTTLNIEELNGVISLTIFPNPTTESIQLSDNLTSEEQYHLIIFDQSGRKVYEKSDFSLSEKITVNSFDTGIYSVVLSSGKKVFSASFVKN